MNGNQHCFTPSSVYYEADAMGPKDKGETNTGPMMYDWVANSIPLQSSESISTVCEGTVENNSTNSDKKRADNTYCSASVVPKTYTETY